MSMPRRIVFVRHGQSESNILQSAQKKGERFEHEQLVGSRVDWKQRLSKEGRKQAEDAAINLKNIYGEMNFFDSLYLSPFIRARETALIIGGDDNSLNWNIDDRLSERIWGIYGVVSRQEQRSHFPLTSKLANDDPWYIRYDGGESLFDVYNRFKTFKNKLWRDNSEQNVLIVAHKQLIQAACYDIEKLLPEEWDDIWKNKVYDIPNLGSVEYSRTNPNDESDVREKYTWRRVISLASPENSPLSGGWVEFSHGKEFTPEQIQQQISKYPPLLG